MSTTFENAKVGDRVYFDDGCKRGWGKVDNIDLAMIYSVKVRFDDFWCFNFTVSGRILSGEHQVLFWDVPQIIAPEQPKRTVKKVLDFWVNAYRDNSLGGAHKTRQDADIYKGPDRVGEAIHIIHEYEVEE